MAATPVALFNGANFETRAAGQSVIALYGAAQGGYIINPQLATDQGLDAAEILYVDPTGPAALTPTATTMALQPGQDFEIAPGQTTPLWVNAQSKGHRFTAVLIQPPVPAPTPVPASFPPTGPTGLVNVIPSYLYQEYNDDDSLQAFVDAYNGQTQNYVDTFNALGLGLYTSPLAVDAFLDWIGQGVYGMSRPALSSGEFLKIGPLNTWELNTEYLNEFRLVGPNNIVATSDDIYKRILTWHLYKGDGKVFNIRWLKRRIMRFLIGEDGSGPNVDNTYQISVTFGLNSEVSIRLLASTATRVRAALYNSFEMNTTMLNEFVLDIEPETPLPNAAIFQEALESGALEFPFQFSPVVTI